MTDEDFDIDISQIIRSFKNKLFNFIRENPNVKDIGTNIVFYDYNELKHSIKEDDDFFEKRERQINQEFKDQVNIVKMTNHTITSKKRRIRGKIKNVKSFVDVRKVSEKSHEVTVSQDVDTKSDYMDIRKAFEFYIKSDKHKCNIKGVKFHISNSCLEGKTFEFKTEILGKSSFVHVTCGDKDYLKFYDKIIKVFNEMKVRCPKCGYKGMEVKNNKEEERAKSSSGTQEMSTQTQDYLTIAGRAINIIEKVREEVDKYKFIRGIVNKITAQAVTSSQTNETDYYSSDYDSDNSSNSFEF